MPSHSSRISLVAAFAALASSIFGSVPYEPKLEFSLTEKWRWHELETLSDYVVDRGVENLDGNLVFTTENHLIVYDGYRVTKHAYPIEADEFDTFDLFASVNGSIYVNTTHGIFAWNGDSWHHALEDQMQTQVIHSSFASNNRGLELAATPSGVYQIIGYDLVPIPELDQHFTNIAIDGQNRFWGISVADYTANSIQFTDEGPLPHASLKTTVMNTRDNAFPNLIAHPDSDEVWSVNWLAIVPAVKFDEVSSSWIPQDLVHLTGNNRHTCGYHLNEDDMAIFSKTAILVRHLDTWHTIEYPEFDFPTNYPFLIVRANGKLVLGGRGEKVYEVDYNSNRQDAYQGLHFQCDVGGRTRWFLSVEGQIIEQDTAYDTWTLHEENVIDTPVFILRSKGDTIWAAGAHEGTAAVSYFNGREWIRELHPELNSLISHHSCRELPNGDIVFGSGEDDPVKPNGGLVIYRKSATGYERAYYAPPLVPARPVGIALTGDDQFWFGGRQLHATARSLDTPFSLTARFTQDRWVDDVSEDDQGHLWAAIWERGLFRHDGMMWHSIEEGQNIVSNQICYILKDQIRPGTLWFATDRGVSRFDGQRWYPNAMPPALRFGREGGNLRQSSDGAIWVNIATRDWFFRKTTKFYLTKRMHDRFKTVRYIPDESPPVVTVLPTAAQATAPANILVNWRGVDKWSITPQSHLKYSYRLNDEPWSEFNESESHVFLDVPTGNYRFEVRALDRDGNISEVAASTLFAVIPPVWQRPWFIALMVVLIITIIFLIGLLFRQRIRHVIQMDEFKLQFFTNISHELRTPLTVILGPLESQLAKLPPSWDRKPLEIAYKNAQRTLGLIDQLLDFRSAETDNIKINLARSDLAVTIREVLHLLKPLVEGRDQTLTIHSEVTKCHAWFDAEVVEKILNNLISNAVKYTQRGGHIDVHFQAVEEGDHVLAQIVVKDNGCGIPSDELSEIFEVFVRSRHPRKKNIRGSGIGLAFTKKLIETCEGTISVESPVTEENGNRQGTRFTVSLPLRKATVDTPVPVRSSAEDTESAEPLPPDSELDEDALEADDPRPLLLVVEDDEEIREFIQSELKEDYRIDGAPDGAVALEIATHRIPDLIISDVMMPEMDGKELCRRIKANESTSHIPVIMLTALKSERHELEGLEIGANDYLAKPIRLSILKKRIHNLLESRRQLQSLFQQQNGEAAVTPREITTNPVDEAFMSKAVTTVEQQLEDPLFDVESFADQLFMSRMTLYRKLKAITGDTPSNFIRSIRMNKAAALLATKQYNVSETANRVGLPDLSSFSTAFKRHFKVSPSQYATRNDPPK